MIDRPVAASRKETERLIGTTLTREIMGFGSSAPWPDGRS